MITDQQTELAEQVIQCHDGKNFKLLQSMSLSSPPEQSEDTITEPEYLAACDEIAKELGVVEGIALIDCLQRQDSQLTLWKANYSKTNDEVFWAVGFDHESGKVKDVLINW